MSEEIKSLNKTELKLAQNIIEELFDKIGVEAEVEFSEIEEGLDVKLTTEDSGILIGYHGETLESLQLISSLAVSKKIGRFVRVMVDVGDYRKARTDYLTQLAAELKDSVVAENRERVITSLKSWERRVIHMLLKDDSAVITESEGSGRDRALVIRPK